MTIKFKANTSHEQPHTTTEPDTSDGGAHPGFVMKTASELDVVFGFDGDQEVGDIKETLRSDDAREYDRDQSLSGLSADQDGEPTGGAPTLVAEDNLDEIWGDDQDNTLEGNSIENFIYGLGGQDTLVGHDGHDHLYGGNGRDELYGGDGDDLLSGGSKDDTIFGGGGDDTIIDNGGNDSLTGGEGADEFFFTIVSIADGGGGGGLDVIEDFELGVDRLSILNWDESYGATFGDYIDEHAYGNADPGVTIEWEGGVIRLAGISKSDLNPFDIDITSVGDPIALAFDPGLTTTDGIQAPGASDSLLNEFGLLA